MTFANEQWARRQDSSDEDRREYERERLIVWTTELLAEMMAQGNVSKADLARKLGTSRANVTQMLSGARNVTLNTLADAAWALGKRAVVKMEPLRTGAFISSPVVVAAAAGRPLVKVVERPYDGADPGLDFDDLEICAGAM